MEREEGGGPGEAGSWEGGRTHPRSSGRSSRPRCSSSGSSAPRPCGMCAVAANERRRRAPRPGWREDLRCKVEYCVHGWRETKRASERASERAG
eukprot:5520300-Pleurochrysis_carterae.AAC.1